MAAAGPAKAGPALTVSHHQNGAEDGPGARLQCKLFFDDVLSVRADELIGFGLVATQGVCVFDSPRFSTTFAGWIMRGSDSTRFAVHGARSAAEGRSVPRLYLGAAACSVSTSFPPVHELAE